MNLEKVNNAAKLVQKLITVSVKEGKWGRTSDGEQPTRENIEKSIGWIHLGCDHDEAKAVMDIVYPKLRKNGILAKLRGEEPVHTPFSRLGEDVTEEEEEEG